MSEADVRLAAEVIQARAAGRHLLLLTDFDGTLCEFHTDPAAVWLAPSRRALLEEIASDPHATLAIVSGRRLEDVRRRTMLGPDTYFAGLHALPEPAQERRDLQLIGEVQGGRRFVEEQ